MSQLFLLCTLAWLTSSTLRVPPVTLSITDLMQDLRYISCVYFFSEVLLASVLLAWQEIELELCHCRLVRVT